MTLTPTQLQNRYRLDHAVATAMSGGIYTVEAYASTADLEARRGPIVDPRRGHLATRYRVRFDVATLIGPGPTAPSTELGFNLAVADYPYEEPATWLISDHVPYSPHFAEGRPFCIGELWVEGRGSTLLGHLLNHVARTLNWDETVRGGGYGGWNKEAIEYHRRVYRGRPLNPRLQYPAVPVELTHGLVSQPAAADLFTPTRVTSGRRDQLFARDA